MRSLGSLVLFVWIGHFRARVQVLVVASMAVDCKLGTNFIDRHLNNFTLATENPFPLRASCVLFDAYQLAIEATSVADHTKIGTVNDLPTYQEIWLVKTVTNPPKTQVTVRVSIPAARPCFLQTHPHTAMRHRTLMV